MILRQILTGLFLLVTSFSTLAQPNSWESRGVGSGELLFAPSISPYNSSEIYYTMRYV